MATIAVPTTPVLPVPAHRVVLAVAPAALYLLGQVLTVGVVAAMAAAQGHGVDLHAWDGDWYLQIARHGYAPTGAGLVDAHGRSYWWSPMAFFPAYPLLVRGAGPVFAGDYVVAAVAVSLVAGMVAACGVDRLARHVTGSRRVSLVAVVLLATAPMSVVLAMAYPWSLVIAGTVWALVGVVERRWLLGALGAFVAGAAAPVGAPAVAVVMLAALAAIRAGRESRWRPLAALFVAPAGLYGYLLWVASRTGNLFGWFAIEHQGWDTGFDGGRSTARFVLGAFTAQRDVFPVVTALIVLAAVGLLAWTRARLPWPVWLHALLLAVLVLGAGGMVWDKARELLPAVTLLIPVAAALASKRGRAMWLPVCALVVFGVWVSGYGLTVWPYSI